MICPTCSRDLSVGYVVTYSVDGRIVACDAPGCLLRATGDKLWPAILAENLIEAVRK